MQPLLYANSNVREDERHVQGTQTLGDLGKCPKTTWKCRVAMVEEGNYRFCHTGKVSVLQVRPEG